MLSGHTKSVNSVDWSPDEKKLATASLDGTARIWDAQTGNELLMLEGHQGRVTLAIWSPDGSQIATTGEDGNIRIWNSGNGELLRNIEANNGEVYSLAWAPNSLRIFSGHGDGGIRIWQVDSGKLLETLRGHQGLVSDLEWSPIDNRLVSGDHSGYARTWNAALSTAWRIFPLQEKQGGLWTMQSATWLNDGKSMVITGGDPLFGVKPPILAIWDLQTNQLTRENMVNQFNLVGKDAIFSPDQKYILYNGTGVWPNFSPMSIIYILNAQTGETVRTFSAGDGKLLRSSAWSPDGSKIGTGLASNGEVSIWDYQTGNLITKLSLALNKVDSVGLNDTGWSPDGSKFSAAGGDAMGNAICQVWETSDWQPLYSVYPESPADCWDMEWSPDSTRLLVTSGNDDQGAKDTTARILDGKTGKELLVLAGHTKQITKGSWSPNGKRVATFSSDGTIRIWDATTGAELLRLTLPVIYFGFVIWSPDGEHLALMGLETLVSVWNVWQSPEELIAYAKPLIFRQLTPAERQQFGLP